MSSPTPPKKDAKELPNELRMVLAFVLMGLILVATPYVYKQLGIVTPTAQTPPLKSGVETHKETPQSAASPAAVETQASAEAAPGAIAASSESEWAIDTSLYRIVFSNRGAVVKNWTLRKFKDSDNKPLDLVNGKGAEKVGLFPFSWEFRGPQPTADLSKALWVAHPSGDGLGIEYDFSDGKTSAKKVFAFERDGYMVRYADEAKLASGGLPHLVEWRAGFGDMAAYSAWGHQASIHYDSDKNKLVSEAAKSAKNGPVHAEGSFSFAGIEDQYFAAVFLPPPNNPLQTTTFDDTVASGYNAGEQPYPGVAVGGDARNQLGLYVGPKELEALKKVNPRLQNIIDWGWFGLIAKPLFLIIQWINVSFVHNYGWAIVVVTICINIALFPLRLANLKSMRKMQALQPEIAKINEKYKGIGMSDPRAAQKQQDTMDLYKKHGVNPMGGCLPMIIQLPFLWAFYKVLSVAIEMRGAEWLWVADLSQPEHFGIHFLPVIMIVSSFWMQKMTPMAGGDPSQQKIMQFMPLMWGFMFWSQSSGLVLYWLSSNLVQIGQQWFFNKTAAPAPATAASARKAISSKDGRKRI
ncbi:MAG: membrane protein insertase YidC [Bryobacteraceae bacterium]|jgi:YidC/Oxa1 family membrane protein insertase